jgi:predicted acyl esterase
MSGVVGSEGDVVEDDDLDVVGDEVVDSDGGWARALSTLRRLVRPQITITDPPAGATVDWDVPVVMRDGVRLRVNVFRPEDDERHPVLVCAQPYGKDDLPVHHPRRHGYRPSPQYHLMRSAPVTHSAWASWESPDPGHWVPRGYVVINADLRGWGSSEGEPSLLSDQEGLDVHDLIEWAALQPWSTGRVGMSGVSYLAISQWMAAATRPPHLAAICPWEGFTDLYRDFARPGGILETGFLDVWGTIMKRRSHGQVDLRREVHDRQLFDDWYAARNRDIEAIDVPALVCGSFSDHNLHSRGSFEGFRRIASTQKWLYTHRRPKWQTFYSPEALEAQQLFFDHFLKDEDTGITDQPAVRVEICEDRTTVVDVRHVTSWPPPLTEWRTLRCRAGDDSATGTLDAAPPAAADDATTSFRGRGGRASFTHRFSQDTDVVGPMLLNLAMSLQGTDDFPIIAGVRKFRDGTEVTFEGSYGFQGDLVTHGMLLTSHRGEAPKQSLPYQPFHPHTTPAPLADDEKVQVCLSLLPSATRFRAGDELRLDIQGHWFHDRDPVHGQFPVGYHTDVKGVCTLHVGPDDGTTLVIPVLPAEPSGPPVTPESRWQKLDVAAGSRVASRSAPETLVARKERRP